MNYLENLEQVYRRKCRRSALLALASFLVAIAAFVLFKLSLFLPIVNVIMAFTAVYGLMTTLEAITRWRKSRLIKSRPRYICERGIMGLVFYEKRDMEMCEQMAAAGYSLVGSNRTFSFKFERSEPEDCCYSVDYTDIKPNSQEFSGYVEIMESGGWKYVFSAEDFHFFKAPKGTTPIYTEDAGLAQKYEKMRRSLLWAAATGVFVAIAFFALMIIIPGLTFPVYMLFLIPIGMGVNLAAINGVSALQNHRRILRLRKARNSC